MQYRVILESAGYIDCPNYARPPKPERENEKNGQPSETARKSPHTGRLRPTIPTVTLADWPATPAETEMDISNLSAVDKARLLREREARWDALDAGQVRTFNVSGHMNVYELQEGILLVCESLTTHHRVSLKNTSHHLVSYGLRQCRTFGRVCSCSPCSCFSACVPADISHESSASSRFRP